MNEESYTCQKCGSTSFRIRQNGKYTEIICDECGRFIRYAHGTSDLKNAFEILRKQGKDLRARKKIVRFGNKLTIRCDRCGVTLYNIAYPPVPVGQYDPLDANFCPNCGTEFMDDQKIFTRPV